MSDTNWGLRGPPRVCPEANTGGTWSVVTFLLSYLLCHIPAVFIRVLHEELGSK